MNAPPMTAPELTIAELEADPHGVFRRHRALTPFIRHESGSYFVLRAKDVEALLRDPRTRQSETEYPVMRGITEGTLFGFYQEGMLTSNGAAHRRRRSPFTRSFAARLISELRPRIRATADALIDGWIAEGEIDLVASYSALIPARTIADLLGLPRADVPHFTKLVYQVSRVLSFLFTPDEIPALQAVARELQDYVEAVLEERRQAPREDFLSAFLAAADEAGELSPLEIVVQIITLIVAGTDTTRVAGGIQVALLLQHREQWNAVCRDPALIPGAVAEALRYEPSVGSVARISLEEIPLDGGVLPAGKYLMLSTMSAMRDAAAHADPDRFDIRRSDQRRTHMVFGGGAHRCLGEALATAELEEGLGALTARLPQLRLAAGPLHVEGHSSIRRLAGLNVAWS
jgi:cytochrome P450 family 103